MNAGGYEQEGLTPDKRIIGEVKYWEEPPGTGRTFTCETVN